MQAAPYNPIRDLLLADIPIVSRSIELADAFTAPFVGLFTGTTPHGLLTGRQPTREAANTVTVASVATLPFGAAPTAARLSAERAIVPAAQRGISVLGHNPAYVQLGEAIPSRFFSVPAWVWNRMTPAERWAANTRFLDRLIARGDEVYLATRASAARPGSFFASELKYLTERGYSISDDGWRLLPPLQ